MSLQQHVDESASARAPELRPFPPIDAVVARARPRSNAYAVVLFRPRESAGALAAVVAGAVTSLPVRASSVASPFTNGIAQGVLVTCEAPRIELGWARNLQAAIDAAVEAPPEPIMGIAAPTGNQTLKQGIEEAADALRRGRQLKIRKPCVSRDDVFAFELLKGDPEVARSLASALAPLTTRHRRPGELIRTLEVYLDAGLSISKAASRLNVHRHTVDNRIARIERALGRSLERRGDRLVIELALQALHLEAGRQHD